MHHAVVLQFLPRMPAGFALNADEASDTANLADQGRVAYPAAHAEADFTGYSHRRMPPRCIKGMSIFCSAAGGGLVSVQTATAVA